MKHPVQYIVVCLIAGVIVDIAIRFPSIIAPVTASVVLVAAFFACACAFMGRKRNIDDPK